MKQFFTTAQRKILIVDDNRIILHLLRLTLDDHSRFQVLEANSGADALAIVTSEHPDLVILDVMMPGEFNGFQICNMIKSQSESKHCKVILLTARSQQSDLELGREAKADHYVTKPFSPKELLELVDATLAVDQVPGINV